MSQATIEALLRERDGYLVRGLAHRVAQVDDQLARLGHHAPTPVEQAGDGNARRARGRR